MKKIRAWLMWCPFPESGPLYQLLLILAIGSAALTLSYCQGG